MFIQNIRFIIGVNQMMFGKKIVVEVTSSHNNLIAHSFFPQYLRKPFLQGVSLGAPLARGAEEGAATQQGPESPEERTRLVLPMDSLAHLAAWR